MADINHIAIIMDGNGRWAKNKGKPRTYGHKKGEDAVKKVIQRCYELEVGTLSLFAFSTENWKRDSKEVSTLFEILGVFLKKFLSTAIERHVRIKIMGDITQLPTKLQAPILNVVEKTKDFNRLTVNIGLNYGGRQEIVRAVNLAVENNMKVDEESFKTLLYTDGLTDPDLVIRTSGEYRFSNFMLYQCAYSELYFTEVLWPDFDGDQLDIAIEEFSKRERRFGKSK